MAAAMKFSALAALLPPLCGAIAPGHTVPSPKRPPGGSGPGPWPNTLTGALFSFDYKAHSRDFDANNVTIYIENQGPTYWSMPRANIGDFSPRLGPKYPFSQDTLKDVQLLSDGGIAETSPQSASTQAWRPSHRFGVVVPTVRQNGLKWDDSDEVFYATTGVCCCCSQGHGYSMLDGQYGNKEPHYNIDVLIGQAGARGEGVVNFGVAWFPFEEGWTGGWLDVPAKSEGGQGETVARWRGDSHSLDLSDDLRGIVTWDGLMGEATVTLPGIDATKDGILLVVATDDESDLNVAVASPGHRAGKGWLVQLRMDSSLGLQTLTPAAQSDFAFVYLPYSTPGLIGGLVEGYSGDLIHAEGLVDVERLGPGQYVVTLMGKKATDGVLLLQATGWAPDGKNTLPVFLSHQPRPDSNEGAVLLVEARHVSTVGGREDFPLTDSDFAFVWVDFHYPMGPRFRDSVRQTCMTAAGTRIRRYWRRRSLMTFFIGVMTGGLLLGLVWLQRTRPGWWRAALAQTKAAIGQRGRMWPLRRQETGLSIGREHSIVRTPPGRNRPADDFARFARAASIDESDDDDDELFDDTRR